MTTFDLNISKLPQITTSNINKSIGNYERGVHLLKSLTIKRKNNVLFTPLKEKTSNTFSSYGVKRKNNGFLLEILFHGLNFNAKRIKLYRPKYYIDVHRSEVFICNEGVAEKFKSKVHKRRLIFFSYDHDLIYHIEKVIKEFKLPDIYTGKGLFSRNDPYVLKRGKVRKK